MRNRLLSIVGSIMGGVATFIETSGTDIIITLTVAFVCGVLGFFGNELGKLILKKIKSLKHANKK